MNFSWRAVQKLPSKSESEGVQKVKKRIVFHQSATLPVEVADGGSISSMDTIPAEILDRIQGFQFNVLYFFGDISIFVINPNVQHRSNSFPTYARARVHHYLLQGDSRRAPWCWHPNWPGFERGNLWQSDILMALLAIPTYTPLDWYEFQFFFTCCAYSKFEKHGFCAC